MTLKFTRKQVEEHNRQDDAMIIIDNVVYNVTPFLEEHPGGANVLLHNAGKDASQCFFDVGHTDEARGLRAEYRVGELVVEDRRAPAAAPPSAAPPGAAQLSLATLLDVWGPPAALAVLSLLLYMYLFP